MDIYLFISYSCILNNKVKHNYLCLWLSFRVRYGHIPRGILFVYSGVNKHFIFLIVLNLF
jgi:hypothetical protein